MGIAKTKEVFDQLRSAIGQPRPPPPELIANQDQVKQMTLENGLLEWVDGPVLIKTAGAPPLLEKDQIEDLSLWVVRGDDVVHAEERCEFATGLESKVIKHTNLTGGTPAFSGGELMFLDAETVVVNGCSGRYGPRNKAELQHAVRAFAESGYRVWSMGFDEETNRPARFLGTYPEWVA